MLIFAGSILFSIFFLAITVFMLHSLFSFKSLRSLFNCVLPQSIADLYIIGCIVGIHSYINSDNDGANGINYQYVDIIMTFGVGVCAISRAVSAVALYVEQRLNLEAEQWYVCVGELCVNVLCWIVPALALIGPIMNSFGYENEYESIANSETMNINNNNTHNFTSLPSNRIYKINILLQGSVCLVIPLIVTIISLLKLIISSNNDLPILPKRAAYDNVIRRHHTYIETKLRAYWAILVCSMVSICSYIPVFIVKFLWEYDNSYMQVMVFECCCLFATWTPVLLPILNREVR